MQYLRLGSRSRGAIARTHRLAMIVAPQPAVEAFGPPKRCGPAFAAEGAAYELVSHVLPLNDVLYIIYQAFKLHNDADMRYWHV